MAKDAKATEACKLESEPGKGESPSAYVGEACTQENQLIQWSALLELGFSLIPLRQNSKEPIESEWTHWCEHPRHFSTAEFVGRNAGICCGPASGILVIDVDDPPKFEAWIMETGNELPDTRVHRTGRGKQHIIYQYPNDGQEYRRRDYVKKFGFEVRGNGSQIVAPGSIHPDTGRSYLVDKDNPIAPAPQWLLEMAKPTAIGSDPIESVTLPNVLSIDEATIRDLPVSHRIKNLILSGMPKTQRSEAQMSVLVALLAADVNKDTIFGIFEHFPIGEKFREKGDNRLQWLAEEMSRALAFIKSQPKGAITNLTDTGNAFRLVQTYGPIIRYCPPRGEWLAWDERRWALDEKQSIRELAKQIARDIYDQAAQVADQKAREKQATHALRTEDSRRIAALVDLARSDARIVVMPDELDRNPWFLNLQNGTFSLKSGLLQAHDPDDLITKLAGTRLDPMAKCPRWVTFLDKIMAGNQALVAFLRRAVGYTLTGSTREQVLFFLYGTGANGKTTFLNVIKALMGEYARPLRAEALMVKRGGGEPFELAGLKGARFVPTSEIMPGRSVAEGLVKLITGEDAITARHLYKDFFEFEPEFKIWLAANEKPTIKGQDNAIWRRIRLVPFTVTIPEEKRDKELTAKLLEELPGILNWALEGCRIWQEEGLMPPEEVIAATEEYRDEMNLVRDFLDEKCEFKPAHTVTVAALYSGYCKWCDSNNVPSADRLTKVQFGRQVEAREDVGKDRSNRQRVWRGVGLVADDTPLPFSE